MNSEDGFRFKVLPEMVGNAVSGVQLVAPVVRSS